jgi:hypothetical protein
LLNSVDFPVITSKIDDVLIINNIVYILNKNIIYEIDLLNNKKLDILNIIGGITTHFVKETGYNFIFACSQ